MCILSFYLSTLRALWSVARTDGSGVWLREKDSGNVIAMSGAAILASIPTESIAGTGDGEGVRGSSSSSSSARMMSGEQLDLLLRPPEEEEDSSSIEFIAVES